MNQVAVGEGGRISGDNCIFDWVNPKWCLLAQPPQEVEMVTFPITNVVMSTSKPYI